MGQKSAIVVGAGIVGLATARALCKNGYSVKVIERSDRAVGASIRNFGMIWPIGQPAGDLYERAIRSREIWREVCDEAGIWYEQKGSLHLAYNEKEWKVLNELADIYRERNYELLNPAATLQKSDAIVTENLLGSLYSSDEMVLDPRLAIPRVSQWLEEKHQVRFLWGKTVTDICYPAVYSGNDVIEADEIYVCSGADFETLYPQLFAETPITKCKLQMLRMKTQPRSWRLGPSLCGGLSLAHYTSFQVAPSLNELKNYFSETYPDHLNWGIHVMVSQNEGGELSIGDSHEYGLTHDPFDRHFINELILRYLKTFARFQDESLIETWNGIYPKLLNGGTELLLSPEQGVTIITGVGGAGMTMSFALCEQIIHKKSGTSSLHLDNVL